MKIGSLFSGYGGLDLAVEAVTGATPAWFVEFEEAPSKVLEHRFPGVPNLGDVTKVDWSKVPPVDILTGGTPCQDLSAAGKRAGMTEGTRSNLWVNMREAIIHLSPRLVVWENVQGALSAKATSDSDMEQDGRQVGDAGGGHLRALGRVLGDLTEIGFDAEWTTIRASDIGAPHHRARVFLIAWRQEVPDAEGRRRDNGQATNDGQADREVDSPWNDSDTSSDAERRYGGAGGVEGSGGNSPFGATAAGRPKHGGGSENGNADDTGGQVPSHPESERRVGRRATPLETQGEHATTNRHSFGIEWGQYAPAIRRWERITRPAPAPTEPNTRGNPRLAAPFAEWLMGLPAGWVTDVPGLSRADQLKAIGNGVCPQQATTALSHLLERR